ncbi:MAG TPA: molybdate ABC transporter substrate-binding protein [Polyangiaceae bacterium]|nr:molybdate ABC transporter substrate-binding protein [Polyangiaceae bacterium]
MAPLLSTTIRGSLVASLLVSSFCLTSAAIAAEVRVAVAANFATPLKVLASEFSKRTGHRVIPSSGATGKLYAQIKNGAPFEVLLAADDKVPAQLEAEGLTVPGSRFTYANGKLVLFSAKPGLVDAQGAVLRTGQFTHLAIANPKLAPYGAAAITVLTRLQLLQATQSKFVQGENIAQTMEFVVTGNAELGFVAWSQVLSDGKPRPGSYWMIPENLYPEIRQEAVILKPGAENPAARAWCEFLKGEPARATIAVLGYGLPRAAAEVAAASGNGAGSEPSPVKPSPAVKPTGTRSEKPVK